MSDALLTIENISVRFDSLLAVDELSLELRGGDLLGLIGPNGAGKTTTLRAAAGLQTVAGGSVRILGRDVFQNSTFVGRHMGFTPDSPTAYDTMSVENYLRFIGRCYDLSRSTIEERIDHWLDSLWLSERKTSKISTLSHGMKKRLAVARTLMPDPHVVLLDEPAGGLDPAGRIEFRRLLASLRDQGKAIIISSHILADLSEYCTHIGIIGQGRMVQYGTVDQVAGSQDDTRISYRVVFARRMSDLAVRLQPLRAMEGVTRLELDGDVITLEYKRDKESAAALLSMIIEAGVPVAEFRALTPDLEQAYLRAGIGQVD